MSRSTFPTGFFQLPWWQETGKMQVFSARQPIVADPGVLLVLVEVSGELVTGVRQQLLRLYPPQHRAYFLQADGQLSGAGHIPIYDLGQGSPQFSAIVVPPLEEPSAGSHLSNLLGLMAFLRSTDGCPWDQEQTHASLRPNMLEEAQEAADAIDTGDMDKLADELGDVLLQVIFHAQIAGEQGSFDFSDIILKLSKKLIRRHPHIFGQANAQTPREVEQLWEMVKKSEK